MKRISFNIFKSALLLIPIVVLTSSCRQFIFGEVVINEEEDPRVVVKMPSTKADIYFEEPPVVTTPNLQNPDKDGAFADWATCLIMVKEGHSHGGGKMHGNYVYRRSPWQQEQFIVVRNTPDGPVVDVDKKSTVTYLEEERGIEGPNYLRVTAGAKTLWGLLFYFYDKDGKLINDKILDQSSHYQIFFSVSEVDDKGNPYDILNVRWRGVGDHNPGAKKADWLRDAPEEWEVAWPQQEAVPSTYFADKKTFEVLQAETSAIFRYTYRDTWGHEFMNDGVRDMFNIRMIPPLTRDDANHAEAKTDTDRVGLKGHLNFDFTDLSSGKEMIDWPEVMAYQSTKNYTRPSFLLPHFYLAVRVMKKTDGNKLVQPLEEHEVSARSNRLTHPAHTGPKDESGWEELIRFNLPFRVFTSLYDSDPTGPDPYHPYYWQMAMELKLNPFQVFEAANNRIIHSNDGSGGEGFGQFFL